MPLIVSEDASRTPWPSSPSSGWASGVDRLTSLPNGNVMRVIPAPSVVTNVTGGVTQTNANYAGFPIFGKVPVSSAQQCVAACAANAQCAVGLLVGDEYVARLHICIVVRPLLCVQPRHAIISLFFFFFKNVFYISHRVVCLPLTPCFHS